MSDLFKSRVLVLDLETSGLPRDRWAAPVEIAAVVLETDGIELAAMDWLCFPVQGLPPEANRALQINGIPRADVEAAPLGPQVLLDLWGLWRKTGEPVVTSFNIDFDRPMLERAAPGLAWSGALWGPCVMQAACRAMDKADKAGEPVPGLHRWDSGEVKWPKLEEAARWLGVPQFEPAHRALADARTAAAILVALRRRGLL